MVADRGDRIRAYRSELSKPLNTKARCNREDNELSIQHTLRAEGCVGLHVHGTKLLAFEKYGGVKRWDIAKLAPQTHTRDYDGRKNYEYDDICDLDAPSESELDMDDVGEEYGAYENVDVTRGVVAHSTSYLPMPQETDLCSEFQSLAVLGGWTASPVAVAVCGNEVYDRQKESSFLAAYDLNTQQLTSSRLAPALGIEDICPAPRSAHMPDVFAVSSEGAVQLYDLRQPLMGASIRLASSDAGQLTHIALAPTGGSGLMCFAGGTNDGIVAFDLRRPPADDVWAGNALYELSTGNRGVLGLMWMDQRRALVAQVFNPHSNEHGECRLANYSGEQGKVPMWPKRAKHDRGDFRHDWSASEGGVVLYNFVDGPMPAESTAWSEDPQFSCW
jgi:hypothetical protein